MNAELTPSKENLQTEAKCLNKDDLPKDDNDIQIRKLIIYSRKTFLCLDYTVI